MALLLIPTLVLKRLSLMHVFVLLGQTNGAIKPPKRSIVSAQIRFFVPQGNGALHYKETAREDEKWHATHGTNLQRSPAHTTHTLSALVPPVTCLRVPVSVSHAVLLCACFVDQII